MSDDNTELFNKAVALIRRGTPYPELESELEAEGTGDVRIVINEARQHVEKMQTQSFDAAVEAARRGESHFEISKKLIKLGFHPYDSDTIAARALQKVEQEQEAETK